MVQGKGVNAIVHYSNAEKASKSGYSKKESYMRENERSGGGGGGGNKQDSKQSKENDKNHGAWGSLYKNRQNFNEMHFC